MVRWSDKGLSHLTDTQKPKNDALGSSWKIQTCSGLQLGYIWTFILKVEDWVEFKPTYRSFKILYFILIIIRWTHLIIQQNGYIILLLSDQYVSIYYTPVMYLPEFDLRQLIVENQFHFENGML